MNKALLLAAAPRRSDERFDREALETCKRVVVDQQPVVHTVEGNRRSAIGLDHRRIPDDGDRVAADVLKIVDSPLDHRSGHEARRSTVRADEQQQRRDDAGRGEDNLHFGVSRSWRISTPMLRT